MKTTHTHRGTCQACGRTHAVDNTTRLVAKHGYTVDFGYFHGVCTGGRGYKPAEFDVSLTHKTIVDCTESAKHEDSAAQSLRDGTAIPETFERWNPSLKISKRSRWGGTYKTNGAYETLPIIQATEEELKRTVESHIFKHERNARGLREHAKFLVAKVLPRFGQTLFDVNDLKPVEAPKVVVDVKAAKVTGTFKTKVARKREFEKLGREFDKQKNALHDLVRAIPREQQTALHDKVYWGPMELHHWRPRHSAEALQAFPETAKDIVARIEELFKAREAVKAAP